MHRLLCQCNIWVLLLSVISICFVVLYVQRTPTTISRLSNNGDSKRTEDSVQLLNGFKYRVCIWDFHLGSYRRLCELMYFLRLNGYKNSCNEVLPAVCATITSWHKNWLRFILGCLYLPTLLSSMGTCGCLFAQSGDQSF